MCLIKAVEGLCVEMIPTAGNCQFFCAHISRILLV